MQERQDLIKAIVASIGPLIAAKNETLKTVLMAEIKAVKKEIKASEERVKAELRGEIKASEERLTKRIDAKTADHEHRIETIEKELHIPKN